MKLTLSTLRHTWLIDLDGTILRHNGHLEGCEELLPGVKGFWDKIPTKDLIVLLTARQAAYSKDTVDFLRSQGIRFDHIIFDLPSGERVLLNDMKPSGLPTAHAINLERNDGLSEIRVNIDSSL